MRWVFALLAVFGTIFPLSQFVPWLVEHGLNLSTPNLRAFASDIVAFAWFDVIISVVVVLCFIFWEGWRLHMRRLWLPAVGTCVVGVSLGLPLFLFMRELKLREKL